MILPRAETLTSRIKTMTKFIPVNAALKALAANGHEVAKLSAKHQRVAGFGGPRYLVDGQTYDLSGVRALVADLGIEKDTKTAAEKPRREIDDLADAIAQNAFCQRKQLSVCPFGYRNLNGQVVHTVHWVTKEGEKKTCTKTVAWIRDYCKRNGVID